MYSNRRKLSIRNIGYYTCIIFMSYILMLCSAANAQATSNLGISTGNIIEFFQGFNIPLPSTRQRFFGDIASIFKSVQDTFNKLIKGDSEIIIMALSGFIPFVLILMLIKKFQSHLKEDSKSRVGKMRSMLKEAKKESKKMKR